MNLKKSVCRQCREQAFGKKGWNDFAEAWFKPNEIRSGVIYCPTTLGQKMIKDLKEKIMKDSGVSEGTKEAFKSNAFFLQQRNPLRWDTKCNHPPVWCPFYDYHYKSSGHRLPKKVPRYKE